MSSPHYRYADFWEQHGKQSFWLTRNISYRLGAALAVPASRLGLSPNAVSILSLVTGVAGAVLAAVLAPYSWTGAIALLLLLHFSYGLDCADGVLARATGRGSPFGQLLDKVVDLSGSLLVLFILAIPALEIGAAVLPARALPAVLALAIIPRHVLAVAIWLKEATVHGGDRLRGDQRERTAGWYLKKAVGNISDDVTYRTALALAWGLGWFWEFLLIFSLLMSAMLPAYMASAWQEMRDPPAPETRDGKAGRRAGP